MDYLQFVALDSDVISWDVSGSANGSNELDVELQQQQVNGSWETLEHFELNMPSDSNSGSTAVHNHFASSSELLRFRLGRKIGTQAIDWEVTF